MSLRSETRIGTDWHVVNLTDGWSFLPACHSEERSDEESLLCSILKERFSARSRRRGDRRETRIRPATARCQKWVALLAAVLTLAGCGYHVAGHAATFPSDWQAIAVPAFVNRTARYRIEQQITEAVIREMISRTHYRVVQDTNGADAVLHGSVISIETTPILFDATTGQATTMLVTLHVQADLVDNHTQKTVYKANDMVFRNEYQISSDIRTFFQEQDPAVQRMAHDFASQFVSDILENF